MRETPFQRAAITALLADGDGRTYVAFPDRTLRGSRLEAWMVSISDDRGRLPTCGHPVFAGEPMLLLVDAPDPRILCGPCIGRRGALDGLTNDRICRLCGEEPADDLFTEFAVPAANGLMIIGNACENCMPEIRTGLPQ